MSFEIPFPLITDATKNLSLEEVDELERALLSRRARLIFGERNAEPQLLTQINSCVMNPEKRARLEQLSAAGNGHDLPESLQNELLALIDECNSLDAKRLELASQLAAIRGVSLEYVIQELGLFARP